MTEVEELLWQHIASARWYAGKGRDARLGQVVSLPWLTAPGLLPAVRVELVQIEYAETGAEPDYYQVPVCYRDADTAAGAGTPLGSTELPDFGEVTVHDATTDPFALELLLSMMLGAAERGEDARAVRAVLRDDTGLTAALTPEPSTADQSNSSVMYGDVAMLKIFRRLVPGRNLDIEVHEALGEEGSGEVARLFGWVEADWDEGWHADLAMLVQRLREAQDGYRLACDYCAEGRDFSEHAHALGQALAGVHRALAHHFPITTLTGDQPAQGMQRRLVETERAVAELAPYRDALSSCYQDLAKLGYPAQRIHGDFHLGQTLLTTGDGGERVWKIIDFEGEPMKSPTERREPDSVWRDVAGMLRSFDYAGAATVGAGGNQDSTQAWVTSCRTAFCAGYGENSTDEQTAAILRAYEADKAVYEVMYEARNRPDWLPIPLAAVSRLAGDSSSNTLHNNT